MEKRMETGTGATCVTIFSLIACLFNSCHKFLMFLPFLLLLSHLSSLVSKLHSISANTTRWQSAGKQLEKYVRATRATCKWQVTTPTNTTTTAISTRNKATSKPEMRQHGKDFEGALGGGLKQTMDRCNSSFYFDILQSEAVSLELRTKNRAHFDSPFTPAHPLGLLFKSMFQLFFYSPSHAPLITCSFSSLYIFNYSSSTSPFLSLSFSSFLLHPFCCIFLCLIRLYLIILLILYLPLFISISLSPSLYCSRHFKCNSLSHRISLITRF